MVRAMAFMSSLVRMKSVSVFCFARRNTSLNVMSMLPWILGQPSATFLAISVLCETKGSCE